MKVPFFLGGIGSVLFDDGVFGGSTVWSAVLSPVPSSSPFELIGGNLLLGYGDLFFCADMRVSDGPLAFGLVGISLLFLGQGVSFHSSYCFPALALRGI